MAISLFEALDATGARRRNGAKIQIIASDISAAVIEKARRGVYSAGELQPLPRERRDRYFARADGGLRAVKSIRDAIAFTVHDFLRDPPFRNMHLISCRNVFIYLDPFLQKKALATFHYALRENGLLLLGRSESIGKQTDLFAPFAEKNRIYSRKAGGGRPVPATAPWRDATGPAGKGEMPPAAPAADFRKSAEAVLLLDHAPAGVIVDKHYEIVHINGNIGPFVAPSPGRPTHDLMKTARKELAFELRNALHRARESRGKVRKEGIPIRTGGARFSADLEVVPLTGTAEPHYLVLFWKRPAGGAFPGNLWKRLGAAIAPPGGGRAQRRNTSLEKEMERLREDMRSIGEEQEAYHEELQSANEEMQSANEEMQSLNEELETSKEELQSTNEELVFINRELTQKQEELNDALTYCDDIIATVREPFLVLDSDLRIQKANSSYYTKFDMGEKEVAGKRFLEVQGGLWDHGGLRPLLQRMLSEQRKIVDREVTVATDGGGKRTFQFNAREIVRGRESEKLILLEIADITERKAVERDHLSTIEELNRTNGQLDQFVHVASHDLQEPLRKITTFAGRITDKGKGMSDRDMGTYLEKIRSSSARMSALIRSMLNYARLAHHEQLFEPTDLNTVLGEILSDFELLIEQKGAEMDIGHLPKLEAIPLQVNQLFYNLVSNALKFSRQNVPPKVSISSRKLSEREARERGPLDPGLSYHEIVVRDNGIGIGLKYRDRIFDIFQRLDPSGQYPGTGIGLALCKRIAENHHGHIFAESAEGAGAAFHILLPVEQPKGK